jgi:hypothetical protein
LNQLPRVQTITNKLFWRQSWFLLIFSAKSQNLSNFHSVCLSLSLYASFSVSLSFSICLSLFLYMSLSFFLYLSLSLFPTLATVCASPRFLIKRTNAIASMYPHPGPAPPPHHHHSGHLSSKKIILFTNPNVELKIHRDIVF